MDEGNKKKTSTRRRCPRRQQLSSNALPFARLQYCLRSAEIAPHHQIGTYGTVVLSTQYTTVMHLHIPCGHNIEKECCTCIVVEYIRSLRPEATMNDVNSSTHSKYITNHNSIFVSNSQLKRNGSGGVNGAMAI